MMLGFPIPDLLSHILNDNDLCYAYDEKTSNTLSGVHQPYLPFLASKRLDVKIASQYKQRVV